MVLEAMIFHFPFIIFHLPLILNEPEVSLAAQSMKQRQMENEK
jgi:hypothetical protein